MSEKQTDQKVEELTWNAAHTLAMAFNGKIYNFQALKKSLFAKDHDLAIENEAQLVLAGFEAEGDQKSSPNCLCNVKQQRSI